METIYLNRENLAIGRKRQNQMSWLLGFFDGLHNGHCEVIKTALRKAKKKMYL